ncbi:MAG: DUF1513 domain-containing protein [Pseudomonadota bacterium]
MAGRRSFLAGMLAAGLATRATWAEVGGPAFLSAARTQDGAYVLCGVTRDGDIAFQLNLPARGHAAAAHPLRAEAVAFARRPGTYAIVLDCASGAQRARLDAPNGRHFYGHGTFSADGDLLFTSENDYEAARGVIGIWDARTGYRRLGEIQSGGVGPHDIRLMPDGKSLVVANGGIETHPEAGRTKLNLPTMRSNLSYLTLDGRMLNQVTLGDAHQRNSIRHLALGSGGTVAFAMQWQGDPGADIPLLGVHTPETGHLRLLPEASIRRLQGYLGSVAMTADGETLVATSPRAGLAQVFKRGALAAETPINDVCGVASTGSAIFLTSGQGLLQRMGGPARRHPLSWDNHLVAI